uniref:3'-5' exonuclease domain-containing protein n=1 Tax=Denticeps clupeoides TaxID=299321 RepID=A0AAY4BGD6_9TELE
MYCHASDHEDVEQYINYIVIDEFHEKFMPAVMHIRKQKVIGIGADGFGALQHERLCWLQIATKNKVYLFDILLLGARAFKNGLSVILETSSILKVTHNCRIISGGLMAQFGVKLTNVFDTQVADFMYFNMETGGLLPDRVSTLQEVVSLHLKMPTSHLTSLDIKSQLAKEDSQVWCIRPCSTSLLKVMALSVMHLQPLRLVLLDALMSDYTSLVDSCLCSHRNEIVQTQDIGQDSELELPRELRQIQQLRKDRQAWAQEVYPQTEGGLLLRFKPPLTPAAADVATPCGNSTPVIPTDFSAVPSKSPRKTTSAESVVSSQTDSGLEILMNTMGRGRFPVGDCIPRGPAPFPGMGRGLALPEKVPSVGRGFHHQIPQLASPLSLSFRKGE